MSTLSCRDPLLPRRASSQTGVCEDHIIQGGKTEGYPIVISTILILLVVCRIRKIDSLGHHNNPENSIKKSFLKSKFDPESDYFFRFFADHAFPGTFLCDTWACRRPSVRSGSLREGLRPRVDLAWVEEAQATS